MKKLDEKGKIGLTTKRTKLLMKKVFCNRIILPSFTFIVCLFVTYLIWNIAVTNRKSELHAYLEYRSNDVYNRIEQRILNYEQILRNIRGLFYASDNVNRREFSLYFNSLDIDKNYPGIQGIGFSILIPTNQIKEHIADIQNEGFSQYKIWPEGKRETYTSIIYLEPFKGLNLRAFGYDMFSEPVRKKAMQTALDSNKTTISGKVNLVQETGNKVQVGFLIYLPIYKNGTTNLTIGERRKNIIGWVYSPFRMGDFMEGLFGERGEDIHVEIYDWNSITNETKMYDSKQLDNNLDEAPEIKKEIHFNGNKWTILVKYTPQLELRMGHNAASTIRIVGIILSILFTIITWLLVNKKIYTIKEDAKHKLAASYLKKLQQEQQILLDNIPAWVFYKDTENRFIRVNKTFADVMEMSIEQLEGKSLFDIFPKDQAEAYSKDDKEVLTSSIPKLNIIELMESPKGNFWVQTDKVPYIDIEGNIVGIIGFSLNITDRINSEKSLRESNQIIKEIIDSIPLRVFWKDKNLVFLGCNKLFALDAGFTDPKEIIGKDDFQMGWHNQAELYREDDRKVIESGQSKLLIEEPQNTPDGNNITLLTSKIPLLNSEGEIIGVLGIYFDISERKAAEEELMRSHEQLTKLNATKDKFFSIIAHDLRSPFNGFINLTELMADSTENFSHKEFVEHSKSMNKAAKDLYKLLENLLQWAQVQDGSIDFSPQYFDLLKIVSQSIDTIYQRANQKGITIINEIGNSQKVFADEKMIGAVLRNLLSNAVKFTMKDGQILLKSKRFDNGAIEISVADNGVGISAIDVKRIFKVEEKVSSLGTEGETSTGLGLLLCKEFIELHGGNIWAESEENVGSTFYFTLKGRNEDENE
ncbi:MAG: CHASE domain-containing protein [Melioribacteraceae bacterium]|nr:CHASE domain-containing protein [Melioribacteraceae bacterium]